MMHLLADSQFNFPFFSCCVAWLSFISPQPMLCFCLSSCLCCLASLPFCFTLVSCLYFRIYLLSFFQISTSLLTPSFFLAFLKHSVQVSIMPVTILSRLPFHKNFSSLSSHLPPSLILNPRPEIFSCMVFLFHLSFQSHFLLTVCLPFSSLLSPVSISQSLALCPSFSFSLLLVPLCRPERPQQVWSLTAEKVGHSLGVVFSELEYTCVLCNLADEISAVICRSFSGWKFLNTKDWNLSLNTQHWDFNLQWIGNKKISYTGFLTGAKNELISQPFCYAFLCKDRIVK